MTVTDCLLILTVLANPAPLTGFGWQVEEELTARDAANAAMGTAVDDRVWQAAAIRRDSAEARLARLLDVQPQPFPALDYDDGWGNLLTLTCESCPATDATAEFTAYEAGETDGDRVCDDCHAEHAALAASDESNRIAYLYR